MPQTMRVGRNRSGQPARARHWRRPGRRVRRHPALEAKLL